MRQMRNRTMKSADLATLRALHGRKRWEHIWAYYKLPIIGILIVLYIFGYAAYRHFTKKEAVLYVSLVNISAGSDLTGQHSLDLVLENSVKIKMEKLQRLTQFRDTTWLSVPLVYLSSGLAGMDSMVQQLPMFRHWDLSF